MAEAQSSAEIIADEFLTPQKTGAPPSDSALAIVEEFLSRKELDSTEKVTGQPGLEDLGVRANISAFFRPQTAAEANRVFQGSYPEGDIIRDPQDKELYFRTSQKQKYRKLDPDIFTDSGRWRDFIYDAAEFAAYEVPVIAGELGAFALTKNPSSAVKPLYSAVGNAAKAFGGAGGGELVRQLSQVLGGKTDATPTEVGKQVATTGLYGAAGELASKPITAALGVAKGLPAMALETGAGRALSAQLRQGLPTVTPGQTVINPLIKKWEKMGVQFSPRMITHFKKQRQEGMKKFKAIVEGAAINLPVALRTAVDEAEQRIFRSLPGGAYPRYRGMTSRKAGEQILRGVSEWDELAKGQVDVAYSAARNAAPASYDIGNLVAAANQVLRGTRIGLKPRKVEGKLLDQYGDPIMKTVREKERVGNLTKEVREAAELIGKMDPNLPTIDGKDATDQLMALRHTLWDAKTPAPGDVFRQVNRDADALYRSLSKVMDSPVIDVENARELWKYAATAARRRFAVLDKAVIGQILKTRVKGGESQLAHALVTAGRQSDIDDLKRLIPGKRFEDLKAFVAGDLLRNPAKIKSMDPDVLRSLVGKQDLDNLTRVLDDVALLRSSPMAKAFNDNISGRVAMMDFLSDLTPSQTDAFIKAVKNNAPLTQEIKRSVLNGIGDLSMDASRQFNLGQFNNAIKTFTDVGLFRKNGLWSKTEQQAINDFRAYLNRVAGASSQDAGISLMAAGIASPAQLARGEKGVLGIVMESAHQMLITGGLGRFLTSPAGARILRGSASRRPPGGQAAWGSNKLKAIMAAAAASMAPKDEETE